MKINKEQLTNYALGELNQEESAQIEKLLAADPELKKELEDIKRLSLLLSQELKVEPLPRLLPEERKSLQEKLVRKKNFWVFLTLKCPV